jgi:hypothetical protein
MRRERNTHMRASFFSNCKPSPASLPPRHCLLQSEPRELPATPSIWSFASPDLPTIPPTCSSRSLSLHVSSHSLRQRPLSRSPHCAPLTPIADPSSSGSPLTWGKVVGKRTFPGGMGVEDHPRTVTHRQFKKILLYVYNYALEINL